MVDTTSIMLTGKSPINQTMRLIYIIDLYDHGRKYNEHNGLKEDKGAADTKSIQCSSNEGIYILWWSTVRLEYLRHPRDGPKLFSSFFSFNFFILFFPSFSLLFLLRFSSLDFWKITSKKKKRSKPDKQDPSRPISLFFFFPVFLPRLLLHLHPPGLSLTRNLAQDSASSRGEPGSNRSERNKGTRTDCAYFFSSFSSPSSSFSSTFIPLLDSIFSIPPLFVPINLLGRFVNTTH
ncbi:uncharacterized protein BDW47DRAFT_15060 [Aspergillus candidus]|uniref:Uncharacterized protein n=1 Tax=Aspergillus candidus TaxID=41067 RepID=A0A2I2FFB5_ASPCN|nr:hypothetical protein BDW47DRAFT_15060 [Aspergillus candidus]PLB39326.1 hypothetical protein BDW47DRAFT_15060 [Aspergillus candidus]